MHTEEPQPLPEEARLHGEEVPEEVSEETDGRVYSASSIATIVSEEIGERPSGGTGVYQIPRGVPGAGGGLFSPRGPRPANREDESSEEREVEQ